VLSDLAARSSSNGALQADGSLFSGGSLLGCGSLRPVGSLPYCGSLSVDGALERNGSLTLDGSLQSYGSLTHDGALLLIDPSVTRPVRRGNEVHVVAMGDHVGLGWIYSELAYVHHVVQVRQEQLDGVAAGPEIDPAIG
jgi:hypothetical protein